jgi:hydroxypyruvate isomerase
MLFREHPFLERPAAARRAGFSAIESWWPPENDVARWPRAVRDAGVRGHLVNSYAGDLEAGERGFLNVSSRHEECAANVAEAIRLAGAIGAGKINVLVGRRIPGASERAELASIASVLRECAGPAAAACCELLIEPLNAVEVPGYLVPTPRAAAELVEAVGSPAVRLLFDVYHVARAGFDPISELAAYRDLIGHIQYADAPGRGPPGTGRVDIRRLVDELDAIGYDGLVGLEFNPGTSTTESLSFLADIVIPGAR